MMTPAEVVAESKNWNLDDFASVLAFSDWMEEQGEPDWRYMIRTFLTHWGNVNRPTLRQWFDGAVERWSIDNFKRVVESWKSNDHPHFKEYDVTKPIGAQK